MKVLSRVASPAGFALMLLLFFLLPFISVSCDVPGMGTAGVNYSGTNLMTGSDPSTEVPDRLKELVDSLPGSSGSAGPTEDPPDPGVQIFAIITVALAVAGLATVLISRLRTRLLGAAGAALLTLAMAIVTLLVAQGNLEDLLLEDARESGVTGDAPGVPDIEASIPDLIRTEVGFWLVVVVLAVVVLLNVGLLLTGRMRAVAVGGGGDVPFGAAGPPRVDPLTGEPLADSAPPTTPFAAQPPATDTPAAPPDAEQPPSAEPTPPAEPWAVQPLTAEPTPPAEPATSEPSTPAAEPPATQPPSAEPATSEPSSPAAEPPDGAPPAAPPADSPPKSP